jgi:PKD repeat protein
MGNLRKTNRIKTLILSFSILWLLSAPFPSICAAELPVDIKTILLKITSSVADQGMDSPQKDNSESKSLPGDAKLVSSPLPVPPVQLYFPLNNNDVKNYQGVVLGVTYYGTYNYYQVSYSGRTCYLEQDSFDGSQVYYGYSGSQIQMYGATIGSESFSFTTPLNILNDSILSNGGSLQSSTTLTVEGYTVTVNVTVVSNLAGSVTIPLGKADNCRSIDMTFSYSIPGESETMELRDVWILAPNIGKLKIAVFNQYLYQLGWLNISGGTVGGKSVDEILNPTVADFEANLLYGLAPLTVSFTDRSSGLISNWSWNFGDGTSSSIRNPTHVYAMPGTYSVSLTVSSAGGSDTEVKPAYIRADHAGADLNNDNKVDLYDAILALQIIANLPQSSQISMGNDVNGDNQFGLEEAIYILQNVAGMR